MTKTNSEDGLGQRLHDATDQILDVKQQVVKNLTQQAGDLEALIKKHPLLAIGIGLGIGYLIARLVHR
jgi:ElaB/YqjD/DUF883 family membrane-anchored ribosome-binding protein